MRLPTFNAVTKKATLEGFRIFQSNLRWEESSTKWGGGQLREWKVYARNPPLNCDCLPLLKSTLHSILEGFPSHWAKRQGRQESLPLCETFHRRNVCFSLAFLLSLHPPLLLQPSCKTSSSQILPSPLPISLSYATALKTTHFLNALKTAFRALWL